MLLLQLNNTVYLVLQVSAAIGYEVRRRRRRRRT